MTRLDDAAALFGPGFGTHVVLLVLGVVISAILAAVSADRDLQYSG